MEESEPIAKEIRDLIEKQKVATTDEEKEKIEAEIKPKAALFSGYRQRAADAFSRAYKFYDVKSASEKAAKSELFVILAKLLGAEEKNVDQRVASLIKGPFPDPISKVIPIDEPEPAKTPGADSAPGTKPAPAKAKPAPARKPRP